MNLKRLAEHTIDVDLLPEKPIVLDVGCRSFNFCDELLTLRPLAQIVAIDPGPDIDPSIDARIRFLRFAIVETHQASVWLKPAGFESVFSMKPETGWAEVPTKSFRQVLDGYGPYFDLIKFDCESAEFGILEHWPGRCAGQISIEFHDNMVSPDGRGLPQSYFDALVAGPLHDYRVIQNEPDYCGTHSDALLVLR